MYYFEKYLNTKKKEIIPIKILKEQILFTLQIILHNIVNT